MDTTDLDLHHVQPTGVLGCVVEFQSSQNTVCLGRGECFIQGPGRVGRQVIQHHADQLRLWIVRVHQIAHTQGEILRSALRGDLHMTPRPMRVEEHEQVRRAVAAIFAIVTLRLARLGRDWRARLADQLRPWNRPIAWPNCLRCAA